MADRHVGHVRVRVSGLSAVLRGALAASFGGGMAYLSTRQGREVADARSLEATWSGTPGPLARWHGSLAREEVLWNRRADAYVEFLEDLARIGPYARWALRLGREGSRSAGSPPSLFGEKHWRHTTVLAQAFASEAVLFQLASLHVEVNALCDDVDSQGPERRRTLTGGAAERRSLLSTRVLSRCARLQVIIMNELKGEDRPLPTGELELVANNDGLTAVLSPGHAVAAGS